MAKKDDAAFGLLALLALVILILTKVFEFVMDNILFVGIMVGVIIVIFSLIKYTQYQDDKKEREINIQNANLKGIKEKYEQSVIQINQYRENALFELYQIDKDLKNYQSWETVASKNPYDPLEAISKLKNILIDKHIMGNRVWDLIYDNRIFIPENPLPKFERRIKNIDFIDYPFIYQYGVMIAIVSLSKSLSPKYLLLSL